MASDLVLVADVVDVGVDLLVEREAAGVADGEEGAVGWRQTRDAVCQGLVRHLLNGTKDELCRRIFFT